MVSQNNLVKYKAYSQKEWAFLLYALRFTACDGRYASGVGICQLKGHGTYQEFAFPCPGCGVEIRFGMEIDQKNVKDRAAGSDLGYCDLVASIKKLAVSNSDFGMRVAEFKPFEKKDFHWRNLQRMRAFYIGWPANTIYATVSHKYDQIQQTLSTESIKPQIVPPPSPQFIAIKEQVDTDVFSMMFGKSATLSRKSKILQIASAKLSLSQVAARFLLPWSHLEMAGTKLNYLNNLLGKT